MSQLRCPNTLRKLTKDFTDPTVPHDRVIVVEGQKFYVSSEFLSLTSEFFLTMFTSDFKEKKQQEIVIGELAAEDFHEFLKASVHSSYYHVISEDNYKSILTTAHRFMASNILRMTEEYVIGIMNDNNLIELLRLAFEFNLNELKGEIKSFVTQYEEEQGECPIGCWFKWDPYNFGEQFCHTGKNLLQKNGGCINACKPKVEYIHPADFDHCQSCWARIEKKTIGLLDKSRFIVKYQEKLKELSAEAQLFVFHAVLEEADK